MIKYRTIWSANTDPYISVHISTSYSTSIQKQSYKTLHKFYVRLGRLVVSISPSQEVSVQRTLRNTLIAIILCHEYIKTVPFVRSAYIRKSSLKAFINLKKRRYMRMKISDLLILCVRSVALSRLLMLGQISTHLPQLIHAVSRLFATTSSLKSRIEEEVFVTGASIVTMANPIIGPPDISFSGCSLNPPAASISS